MATFIASRTFFASFALAAGTIVLTFILGRVVCGWVCPLGSIHQLFSFIFKKSKLLKPKIHKDSHTAWKYYLLVFILVGTLFSLDLVGILDPLSLLYRSFAVSIFPMFSHSFSSFIGILYGLNLSSLGGQYCSVLRRIGAQCNFPSGFFHRNAFYRHDRSQPLQRKILVSLSLPFGCLPRSCLKMEYLKTENRSSKMY